MKRKDKNIRDDFTDALNAEMLSRKIFDKAKPKAEEEIFLAEVKAEEKVFESEIKKFQPAKKKSKPKKKSPKKISPAPEIKIPQTVEAETELEKRIFAEAENNFYDEKPADTRKNFHSKTVSENFERPNKNLKTEVAKDDEENAREIDLELYRKLTRAEIAGIILSSMMMAYSLINLDKPLFFMAMSLMSHLTRPFIGSFFGKYNRDVQNGLRSFSIVLFLGALLFIFI